METGNRLRLADVFVSIRDPRQAGKVKHDLVELLVVAVNAVLVGADTFVEIELWAKEKLEWLRRYLRLEAGIPSHDTFGRLFGLIDPTEFEAAFRRWVGAILPALGADTVVAVDGKTSRRTGKVDATPLHLVSAFAAGAGLVLGQRATAAKSNEKTAIPELLATLALEGCIVTIDAMGTQANIAQTIRDRGADYVLAVKDNQPTLVASIRDFFAQFQAHPTLTPHTAAETVEKDHGRLETRRCYAFDQLDCLARPEQWPDLKSFAVIETERCINGKTSLEHRFYISSLPADAHRLARAVRAHWAVENRLHWCMDVAFADDQMRVRTGHAAHNLAVLKHITLNLIRLDPVKRKGGIKARRLIAATSDIYRAQLLGLQ
ncbi:ISAs1 family transposase [Hydrogenophilus thermoluteolus]|uniref:Transposase n=1 Tax=Hydrogenophilus thermoluteolus TaxID=297 RepID=A0A2Z6DW04_HYDTE|nr:ISAs1 family transposase [Hydrogenophilus thermoluteolus]BBD76621.1 transposase [Hydrogenophilus thermoluteolus]BBD78373.1 transposase [Hydrogenophilus thermoluteolus]